MTRFRTTRISLVPTLLVVLGYAVGSAEAAEIVLREQVVPQGELLRLSDLAAISAETAENQRALESLVMFPTPATSRDIEASTIRDRLDLLGIDLLEHRVTGAARVSIRLARDSSELSDEPLSFADTQVDSGFEIRGDVRTVGFAEINEATIESFCRARTQRALEELGWEWTGMRLSSETRSLLEQGCRWLGAEVRPVDSDSEETPDATPPRVVLVVDYQGARRSLPLDVQLEPMPRVVFLRSVVERGTVLNESHVTLRPWPRRDSARTTSDLGEVIGREVRGGLVVDRPIDPAQLTPPTLVKRNTEVRISTDIPGIRVSSFGKALADGGMDDIVLVQLNDPRRPVRARVTGESEVVILGGGQ
ncbi:MAG: flagellar basal body P-ring formation protein FlgA [Planctomycetales bacterium]|nr:flagellar basal body P-ring formation protein FlgA [Planctomycetales bacterium]